MSTQKLADLLGEAAIPPEDAARLGVGVARALGLLHGAGLVHRAVGPESVTVGAFAAAGEQVTLAAPGPPGGYVAPEGAIDARSDVWALGRLLRRMLVGELRGDDPSVLLASVPAALAHIVETSTAPRPTDRYLDARPVALALEAWLATRSPAPGPAPRPWTVVQKVAAAACVAAGAIGVGLGSAAIGAGWSGDLSTVEVEVVPWSPGQPPAPAGPTVDGVPFDHAHADRALRWVNSAPPEDLAASGIYARGVEVLVASRPFASLDALGETPSVGARTVQAIADATR